MSYPQRPPYPQQDRGSPVNQQRNNPYGYTRPDAAPPRGPNPAPQRGYGAPPPRQQPMRAPPPYNQGPMSANGAPRSNSPGQRAGPRPQQPPSTNMEMRQMNSSRPPPPNNGPNPYSNASGNPYANQNNNPYSNQTANPYTSPDSLPAAPTPTSMTPNTQSIPTNTPTPANANSTTSILDQCSSIKAETAALNNQLNQLQNLQSRSISSPDPRGPTAELDSLTTAITATYKTQLSRLTALKRNPATATNAAASSHIASTETALRQTWTRYQTLEASFRKRNVEAAERQYRIVRPDAPESEVKQACADVDSMGGGQVFAQALMQGQRRDQAQTALGAVRQRHEAIAKIERDMIELAELFTQLAETVAVQDVAIRKVESDAEETHQNTAAAVTELGHAEESARKARKKKWICFWIGVVVLIVGIIAILIALHYVGVF